MEWGSVSFGAVLGSIIGATIAFFIRRWYAQKDENERNEHRRREFALDLHSRFNSSEVLKARSDAEAFLLEHVGRRLRDIRDADDRIGAVWLVAREYEFLSIAIEEGIIDKEIVAKYFFEIFIYWVQHFRCCFYKETYQVVERLKYLDLFFQNHAITSSDYADVQERQRSHINFLLEARGKSAFDFSGTHDAQQQRTSAAPVN